MVNDGGELVRALHRRFLYIGSKISGLVYTKKSYSKLE